MDSEQKEIQTARLVFYAFLRSFLDSPPTDEKFRYWLGLLDAMTSGTGSAPLDEALLTLRNALGNSRPIGCQNEYYELFENPFSPNRVQLCASYYTDGKTMGPSLVNLRQLLYNLNIGKIEGFKEPEDHLVFLIDVMMHLIQRHDRVPEESVKAQQEMLEGYLIPCIKGVSNVLGALENFTVYRALFNVATAFLGLEQSLFPSNGLLIKGGGS